MSITGLKITKRQTIQAIIFVVLLVGLIAGVYLVQTRQIFKSKAALYYPAAFPVTDQNSNTINCTDIGSLNCQTDQSSIHIRFNPGPNNQNLQEIENQINQ